MINFQLVFKQFVGLCIALTVTKREGAWHYGPPIAADLTQCANNYDKAVLKNMFPPAIVWRDVLQFSLIRKYFLPISVGNSYFQKSLSQYMVLTCLKFCS